ncbi:MAG: dihydrodipicolinate synthase family protein [Anaerolineales bacterium]|nr:dihydrodipicolinate synthase family protein [Anaerolineales bacterium]
MTGNIHPLAGIYAAALTPLNTDFSPDLEAVSPFLCFLAEHGCHGALLLGTTGEGPSFSPAERKTLMSAALGVRQDHPDFRLLAGTGTPSLQETIDLTRVAFDLGFNGVVVLPPYYYRNASEEGLFAWFDLIIKKAVPNGGYLLGYHIPGITGIGFSLEFLARLKDNHPEKFAGIKDSSHEVDHALALGARFEKDLLVLNGVDTYLQLGMDAGAQGCITAPANLFSRELREIWDRYQQGTDPSPMQAHVSMIREVLEHYLPFPPILKALFSRFYGFPRWSVRPPLLPVAEALEIQTANELAEII